MLAIVQYDFHVPVCGSFHLRVAMLFTFPPWPMTCQPLCWSKLAKRVVDKSVRLVVGPFKNKDHPLIAALSKLITTNTIATVANPEFPFCVLGEVVSIKGGGMVADTSSPVVDGRFIFPPLHSITALTAQGCTDDTVNCIICLNASGSNRGHGSATLLSKNPKLRYPVFLLSP